MKLGHRGARPFFLRIFVSMVVAVFLAQLGVVALAILTVPPRPRVIPIQYIADRARDTGDVERSDAAGDARPVAVSGELQGEPARAGNNGQGLVRVHRARPLLPFARAIDGEPAVGPLDALFGRYEAAVQSPGGRWRSVDPGWRSLGSWPARMLLWIAATMIVVAPLAWFLARRLAAPIGMFVTAAERLGKDPRAPSVPVNGPAEVREAATIFNEMQERLQRYVQDRTMMVAAIAHDLRTPMLRMRFKLDNRTEEARRSMADDLGEMNEMIASVLSFVRELESDRPRKKLELRSVIESVVDDFVDMGADIKLAAGRPVIIWADMMGMKALFQNLIENAVQYGRIVNVDLTQKDQALEVVIEDEGPGIPGDELERVFEPFYRAEPSRSRETGGTGLGLATVRAVARSHGGDVTLCNREEGGLRATVRLPL